MRPNLRCFFIRCASLKYIKDNLDHKSLLFSQDDSDSVKIFGTCHLIGMSTVITNPVLYCWLNKNFRTSSRYNILFSLANSTINVFCFSFVFYQKHQKERHAKHQDQEVSEYFNLHLIGLDENKTGGGKRHWLLCYCMLHVIFNNNL